MGEHTYEQVLDRVRTAAVSAVQPLLCKGAVGRRGEGMRCAVVQCDADSRTETTARKCRCRAECF